MNISQHGSGARALDPWSAERGLHWVSRGRQERHSTQRLTWETEYVEKKRKTKKKETWKMEKREKRKKDKEEET